MGRAPFTEAGWRSSMLSGGLIALLSAGAPGCFLPEVPTDGEPGAAGGWDDGADEGADAGDPGSSPEPAEETAPPSPAQSLKPAEFCDPFAREDLFLSSDDSNSTSSFTQVRAQLTGTTWGGVPGFTEGASLLYVPLRAWEFLNYAQFPYSPPMLPGDLALSLELIPTPEVRDDAYALQIAITAPQLDHPSRDPVSLTFVVDTSGSMEGHGIQRARDSIRAAAKALRAGDKVSIVAWGTSAKVKLHGHIVTGPSDPVLLSHVDSLQANGGGTDLYAALEAGYTVAAVHADPNRIDRVVLMSDGGANLGETENALIAEHASRGDREGIYLVGAMMGTLVFDTMMDDITEAGRGASVFIDTLSEAEKVFNTDFISTMDVAARDVQIRLGLPGSFEVLTFSGEGISADDDNDDPQHLAPNDSMVLYQTLKVCAPEAINAETEIDLTVRWENPHTLERLEKSISLNVQDALNANPSMIYKGRALYTTADRLKAWKWATSQLHADQHLEVASEAVADALARLPGDADLQSLQAMILAAQTISETNRVNDQATEQLGMPLPSDGG